MHSSFTTYSRRNFLGKLAALICTGLTFPAKAFSSSSRSLLRSTPNPDCGHLSRAVAEDMCSLHRQNILSDICLDLRRYRSASIDALENLAQYHNWLVVDFGISELSLETAHALSRMSIGHATFSHIEKVTPAAVALLLNTDCDLLFENVVEVDVESIDLLGKLLGSGLDLQVFDLNGNIEISDALRRALAGGFPSELMFFGTPSRQYV